MNSGLSTGTHRGTVQGLSKELGLKSKLANAASTSSVSQAFTQDMSDWNKESAIVED